MRECRPVRGSIAESRRGVPIRLAVGAAMNEGKRAGEERLIYPTQGPFRMRALTEPAFFRTLNPFYWHITCESFRAKPLVFIRVGACTAHRRRVQCKKLPWSEL
jgi:hypothetical protein